MRVLATLLALLSGPPDGELLQGADLVAWRATDAASVESLESFLGAWPESALAEVAWHHLVDLGWSPPAPLPRAWAPVAKSYAAHQEHLGRTAEAIVVVDLDPPVGPARAAAGEDNGTVAGRRARRADPPQEGEPIP